MSELASDLDELERRIEQARRYLDYGRLLEEKSELEAQMSDPTLWDDPEKGRLLSMRFGRINADLTLVDGLQAKLSEARVADELLDEGALEFRSEIETLCKELVAELSELEIRSLLGGEFDEGDALCEIHAGAGGTDAQDWAQMLARMYSRFSEKEGWRVVMLEETPGEEAGIKSLTFTIHGDYAYGKLKGEHGVHRLVRLSPYNADNLRQTSFAKVEVMPKIDAPDEILINDKDIKVDVYRSGGHGGQSVNTTDSAVRVTHLPTGISVAIQNERSQLQNKDTAMTILRSRLAQLQLEQHQDHLEDLKGPNQSAEWGNQIRSYVLHPYKQVKDLRTRYETSDPGFVLEGNLEPLIDAYLEYTLHL